MNLNQLPMITKVLPFISYARHSAESTSKKLTREQWISADRIVMMVMLIIVVAGAVLFS